MKISYTAGNVNIKINDLHCNNEYLDNLEISLQNISEEIELEPFELTKLIELIKMASKKNINYRMNHTR